MIAPSPARTGTNNTDQRFRMVATDLDGTLLRSDLSVSARTTAALARAAESGARHLVVTGRPAAGCRQLLAALGYQGLAICGQGAQLYEVGADRLLSSAVLDRPMARDVVAKLTAEVGPVELAVVTAGLSGRFLVTPGFEARLRRGWHVVADPEELWAEPIEKVLVRHPTLDDDELALLVARAAGDSAAVTHSGEKLVELLPVGVDKASGLAAAARHLGFTAADTVAFGDMPNDLSMLAWAAHGVAMANGHPDLRANADEIAPSNDEDGVATVLERLFPPH